MKHYKFASLEEFLTDNAAVSEGTLHARHKSLSSIKGNRSFTGSDSYEDSIRIAREGYELAKLSTAIETVEATENRQKMEVELAVSGSVVEMGAFMAGLPENMMSFPMVDDVRFMHLVMETGEHAGVDKEVFLNKSAAATWLVDHLENNGYRVKLDVFYANSETEGGGEAVLVTVKDFQEPMSVGQLAGTMHPGFFRRLMFRHIERYNKRVPYGYGKVETNKNRIIGALRAMCGSDEVIFLPGTSNTSNFGYDAGWMGDLNQAKKWAEHFSNNRINLKD